MLENVVGEDNVERLPFPIAQHAEFVDDSKVQVFSTISGTWLRNFKPESVESRKLELIGRVSVRASLAGVND